MKNPKWIPLNFDNFIATIFLMDQNISIIIDRFHSYIIMALMVLAFDGAFEKSHHFYYCLPVGHG